MGIDLTKDEYNSIREWDITMGNVIGLTNDYFSWKVEKDQSTNRVRNGVKVLMREHGIQEGPARKLLRSLIIDEEDKAL